ncbi:MAG TPA: dTDP-4-dehydrorhamnose 3,5-epimerase family protein [Candidatus Levybacteria bacterium]|nr:dTDP-4-dehydrorhamnose 3,5-epimerase family protein [Candidatus Levybacteria bacterium]
MTTLKSPKLLQGGTHIDSTGTLRFVNDFNFEHVKRFYVVMPKNKGDIRAFHGHMKEAKYVYLAQGKALVCIIPIDNSTTPSKNARITSVLLTEDDPKVLYIPPGYANGFKALTKNTQLIFYSDKTLAQSQEDDYRFPEDYWGNEIWLKNA